MPSKVHLFEKDNEIGVRGEQMFAEWCRSASVNVVCVASDPKWQELDVDFIVVGDDGVEYTYEVKNDTLIGTTGNVFYEDVSNVQFGTIGCFAKTAADFIVICSESERIFYVIETKMLREFVGRNKSRLRRISVVSGSNSSGLLVPLTAIEDFVKKLRF